MNWQDIKVGDIIQTIYGNVVKVCIIDEKPEGNLIGEKHEEYIGQPMYLTSQYLTISEDSPKWMLEQPLTPYRFKSIKCKVQIKELP